MRKTVFLLLLTVALCTQARQIKVLAIGNSFSEDAVEQYLWQLAAAQGDTLVIGNAYIPGCPIERHYNNILVDKKEYEYRKVVDGKKTNTKKTGLRQIIEDEAWEIISLQQASHFSGVPQTYEHLQGLKAEVLKFTTNPKAEIIWHLTWAYAHDATHEGFKSYGRNQRNMYEAILNAVRRELPKAGIRHLIPSGIAIQNARKKIGDYLNRDGFHLSYSLGRYTAACTWCEFLTGKSVVGNPYHPETFYRKEARTAQKAAHKAFKTKVL
ncbi:DUF4886 domain-containing protein [Prevotella sp. KH2C16]|uniref:DUF4886 domain-containing protein n=1 Tax=Prevotella sp. KH2C16 TaxID=1855325 RepID=UPI0008DFD09C|nr:DUF4886 domain-containing protein [Prevotella sp. KH2C16]SFF97482.1 protein of unknown function [Prevotella sp. KH2C16]